MAFQKGHKKYGGKQKGNLNKRHATIVELTEKLGVDPFEILLRFAMGDWKGLGYDARSTISYTNAGIEYEDPVIKPEMRLKAAAEVCQYLHAKRKAIEHSIDPEALKFFEEAKKKPTQEIIDRIRQLESNISPSIPDSIPTSYKQL